MSTSVLVNEDTQAILERLIANGVFPNMESAVAQAVHLLDVELLTPELAESLQPALEQVARRESIPLTRELSLRVLAEARAAYEGQNRS
ncbi:MAG TPA: hypothetical protein PK819_01165 [Thermomicrobiales bacterium]|nr:hypothetical protein [Thermomicrobiales bacterium]